MAKVYEFLATGFEEMEAIVPVDVFRRSGVEISMVSVTGSKVVKSARGVGIEADVLLEEIASFDDADMLLLPGGVLGANNLKDHKEVRKILLKQFESGRFLGAVCAAPLVFASIGILKGKKATIFPGMEDSLINGAEPTGTLVQVDGNVITGAGPVAVLPYTYELLSHLLPKEEVEKVKKAMLYDRVLAGTK